MFCMVSLSVVCLAMDEVCLCVCVFVCVVLDMYLCARCTAFCAIDLGAVFVL